MVDHPAKARKMRRRQVGPGGGGSGSRNGGANGKTRSRRGEKQSPADLRKSFEKYVEMAKATAQAGDRVESEKYYQYAEHFLRTMNAKSPS